jgi:hypothetical protein
MRIEMLEDALKVLWVNGLEPTLPEAVDLLPAGVFQRCSVLESAKSLTIDEPHGYAERIKKGMVGRPVRVG